MKTLLLFIVALLPLETQAANFSCVPFHPPRQQGEERFYRVELGDSSARVEVADLVSPYVSLGDGLELRYSHYSDTASSAGAAWVKDGKDHLVISLMYLGSWWGGNLRVGDIDYDLRCSLKE
jgi:hypothetical protein